MRIVQCLLSLGSAYLAFRIAGMIARDARAGLMAAALIALHPAFILESVAIASETLYIFFLAMGLWLYCEHVAAREPDAPGHFSAKSALCLAGLAFGMATLTRAVAILFPLCIVAHMILLSRRKAARPWLRGSLIFLAIYAALVSTWTIYNLALLGSRRHRQRPAAARDLAWRGDARWLARAE